MVAATAGNVVTGDRARETLAQTFQVDDDFSLKSIFVDYEFGSAAREIPVDITLFSVDDVSADSLSPSGDEPLLAVTGVLIPAIDRSDEAAIVLDSAIELLESSGSEGYALQITGGGNFGFEWRRTGRSGGSVYSNGQAYEDGFQIMDGDRDFALALSSYDVLIDTGIPGDFNSDGTVDQADFTIWRDNQVATNENVLSGNGDGNDTIDFGDFLLWRDHFGKSTTSAETLPEPGSQSLLIAAGLGLLAIKRRRR